MNPVRGTLPAEVMTLSWNRTCPKCTSYSVSTRYDRIRDVLRLTCLSCGYSWTDRPADRRSPYRWRPYGEPHRKLRWLCGIRAEGEYTIGSSPFHNL